MTHKIQNDTKTYLVSMLENKIETNPQDSVFENKRIYEQWYNPMDWYRSGKQMYDTAKDAVLGPPDEERKKQQEKFDAEMQPSSGGFGGGKPRVKKDDGFATPTKTLFGDESEMSEKEEEAEEEQTNPLFKALGIGSMAALGGAAGWAGSKLGGFLSGKGKFGKYAGKGIASLGKQAEEISGKTWIEAQLGKIGQSQLELAAQGAGSPWTKFVIPQTKPQKLVSPQEKQKSERDAETKALRDAIKDKETRDKARQMGLIP